MVMSEVPFLERVAPAMTDPQVREMWLTDPRGALLQAGIDVPEWADITVEEGTKLGVRITLGPLVDLSGELSEEHLEGVAGGGCSCYASSFGG
jgi:hypothetical protein